MEAIKRLIHHGKTKIGRWQTTTYSDQSNCPLLDRFPREIRDMIWEYTLTLPSSDKPVHLHVYNWVFDCCKHEDTWTTPSRSSYEEARVTSVLRSCKAVYEEAISFLYASAHFELVLLSGVVRSAPPKGYASTSRDSWRRYRIGKVRDFHVCTLMKDVTIVVQPVLFLDASQYKGRLAILLKALDYGQACARLHLKFNLPGTTMGHTTSEIWAPDVVMGFMPIAQYHGPQATAQKNSRKPARICISYNVMGTDKYPRTCAAIEVLRSALNIPTSDMTTYDPADIKAQDERTQSDTCLLHQHYTDAARERSTRRRTARAPNAPRGRTRRILSHVADAAWVATMIITSPVVLPVWGLAELGKSTIDSMKRRKQRGESWRLKLCSKI